MLPRLGLEDDRADALDLDGGGVTELDGALHARVQVGEELTAPRHMVRHTGVEVPTIDLVIGGTFAEEGMGAWFVEVELGGASRPRKGKAWAFHPLPCVLLQLDALVR